MKKWKKVVLWIASILVVVAIGGAIAANYAIDKMLGSMSGISAEIIDSIGDEAGQDNTQAPDSSDISQNDEPNSNDIDSNHSDDTPVSNDSPSSNGNEGGGGSTGTVAPGSDASQNEPSKDDKDTGGYSATVSTDKAKEIEENVTLGEKAKVVSILTKRLSASDLATIQSLASGGLSIDEKKEARTLMLEKLTEDEYDQLIAIAAKYGVSQGKSYAEVSKE